MREGRGTVVRLAAEGGGVSERVLIAGASARAAAASAWRAGLCVMAADLFCDCDLHSYAEAVRISEYPYGLEVIAAQLSPINWMYTGGLENEPDLVDAVSRRHALWGNAGATLRRVRDPWLLAEVLGQAGLRYPTPQGRPQREGVWVRKPLRSCGGSGIRRVRGRPRGQHGTDATKCAPAPAPQRPPAGPTDSRASAGQWYFQPWIAGLACSAVYVAAEGNAELVGITRQLIGCRWAGARGFQYVGSVGPICRDSAARDQFRRVGHCLAGAFGLRGLFGVDAVVADGEVWTVEVNPRYTASVEVLEGALGVTTIPWHRDACLHGQLPPPITDAASIWHGKAIVYATRETRIDPSTAERLADVKVVQKWLGEGIIADVPPGGTRIGAGQPVLTLLTSNGDPRNVERRLRAGARGVRRLLHAAAGAEAAIDRDDGP